MKAIIIQDHDAKALLNQLKLATFQDSCPSHSIQAIEAWQSLPVNLRKQLISDLHGRFHYVVTCWLQEQGASTI